MTPKAALVAVARLALVWAVLGAAPARAEDPTQPPPPRRPFRFVLALGFDRGSTELARVYFVDGSSQSLRAGEGMWFSAGAAMPLRDIGWASADLVATLAVKGWEAGGENGEVSSLAFPLEVLYRLRYRQARFGAGVSYTIAPTVSSSGDVAGLRIPYENALGLVLHLDWVSPPELEPLVMFMGLRFLAQRLEPEAGGPSVNASAIGIQVGFEF